MIQTPPQEIANLFFGGTIFTIGFPETKGGGYP